MSISYTAAAGRTLDRITEYCRTVTGTSNTRELGGCLFFWEIDTDHQDGSSVTGDIYQYNGSKVGTFKINPDGSIQHFAFLPPEAYNQSL